MELILGPAVTQFDAAARPMYASFQESPITGRYPCSAKVDLTERTLQGHLGEQSAKWISKEDALMPPAHR